MRLSSSEIDIEKAAEEVIKRLKKRLLTMTADITKEFDDEIGCTI